MLAKAKARKSSHRCDERIGADDLLVNVLQIMGNARAKAASRLDEILVDEQQNNAVFRDLAKDAAQGDRSVHTPFAFRIPAHKLATEN